MGNQLVEKLKGIRGLKVECPECSEEFILRRATLFGMYDEYPVRAKKILDMRRKDAERQNILINDDRRSLRLRRKKIPERISVSTQSTNYGQISEQILPAFITFPYKRSECRVLLKPIDYVIFEGLSGKSYVHAVKFVDVKTGAARLSKGQREIRNGIVDGEILHTVIE